VEILETSPSLAMISRHNPSKCPHVSITVIDGYCKITTTLNMHARIVRNIPERQLDRIRRKVSSNNFTLPKSKAAKF